MIEIICFFQVTVK